MMSECTTLINDRPCVNTYLEYPMTRFVITQNNEGRITRFSLCVSCAVYDVISISVFFFLL